MRLLVALALAAAVVGGSSPSTSAMAPQSLPSQANVELDGELEIEVEDGPTSARLLHFLNRGSERIKLEFASDPPTAPSGTRIRARGRLQNNTLMLNSQSDVQTLSLAAPNTFGEQRTIVILINFQDRISQPYTPAAAWSTTFETTSNFFRENSSQQTWLTGAVYGWFTIAANSTTCDTNLWANLADQAAAAAGATMSTFQRRIYAFPQTGACGWWGLGTVGGNPSRSWINGSYTLKVVGHELGHNFGNYHSNSQPCDSATCSTVEYGDDHDIMGNPTSGHMTAFQKERLGWLNYGSSPPIEVVGQSGSYWIDAMSAPTAGAKALKILKSVDSSGRRTWFYVESRGNAGFDSGVTPGVLVHTGSEASGNTSLQYDLDRTTSTFDGLLDIGQTFTDPQTGLSITTTSLSQSGATLSINYAAPACTPAAPTVTLSGGSTWAAAGVPVNYTVTVRNNDGSTCANSTFNMAAQVPAGWTATFASPSVSLTPGSAQNVGLTLVAPVGSSGAYNFQVSASRAGSTGSVNGTVQIAAGLSVSLTFGNTGNGKQAQVTVRANSAAVPGAAVTLTMTDPTGRTSVVTATTNGSGVATHNYKFKGSDPRGLYRVVVSVSANGLTGAAVGEFTR